jgi:hypothetical protein
MSGKEINTANIKLAILLISTHGGIDRVGDAGEDTSKEHTEDINIRKINATTPGVCNLVNPLVLEAMGKDINKFINDVKREEWESNDILSKGASNLELTFESPEMGQCELFQLTRALRELIPQTDDVLSEAKETEAIKKAARASKKRVEVESELLNPEPDIDEIAYSENIGKAYQMDKWGKGDLYLDKSYSMKGDQRRDENHNPYDNTIRFLGVAGIPELDVIKNELPYSLRNRLQPSGEKEEGEDVVTEYPTIYIQLSKVLEELVEKGYTDTIIIDLSCSSGYSGRENRALKRSDPFHYGGKKQKRTKKYKKSNGKTRKTKRKTKKNKRKTHKTRKK